MHKILHIQKVTGIAGSEKHLLELLPRLNRKKYDITFLVLSEPGRSVKRYFDLLEKNGVQTAEIIIRANADPICFWQIFRYIKSCQFSVVHTHLIHADVYGFLAARLARAPFLVSTRHNDNPFRTRLILRALLGPIYRSYDHIIAISDWLAQFSHDIEGVHSRNITTVHYGLNPQESQDSSILKLRETLSVSRSCQLIVSVGRIIEQKGHSFLIEAIDQLVRMGQDIYLIIVGDGPKRRSIEAQIRNHSLEQHVRITGWQQDVNPFLRAADIFVHPSLWEGFGLVLLEAMISQKPIVASSVSAIPEIVVDGVTGILVLPADAMSLSEGLCRLLEDPGLAKSMGERGRARALEAFSPDRMVRETERVYQELLD